VKIRADRKQLAATAAWVAQALPKNPSLPAMAGIRLRVADGALTLSAFDYDVHHEARLAVEVASDGECLVSGAFLRTITAELSGKEVELVLDEERLTITSGRSTYRANLLDLADYPTLPGVPPTTGTVDAALLADAVASCVGPTDDAAPTPAVAGLRVEAAAGTLDVVGTDGRLLIHRALDWSGDDFEVTLSSGAIAAAVKGLAGPVTVGVTEQSVGLSDTERTVVMRTISHQYAKWRLVPRPSERDRFGVIVERDELAEAVKRAALLAKSAKEAGAVVLTIEHDSIEVTSSDATAGGSEVIDAQGDGREVIPFSPMLLGLALGAMESGPIRLGIDTRRTPGMAGMTTIRPVERADIDDREAVLAARKGGEAR
jgi:DNA polymerase-3 subunit beta